MQSYTAPNGVMVQQMSQMNLNSGTMEWMNLNNGNKLDNPNYCSGMSSDVIDTKMDNGNMHLGEGMLHNPNAKNNNNIVKKKKNATRPCEACQRLRRKCSGANPCEYCKKKGRECTYAEPTKRGPKKRKAEETSNPNDTNKELELTVTTTEHALWMQNERNHTVDSFFNMRAWWSHLLNRNELSSPKTVELQVISNTIKAFMARYMKNTTNAQQLFQSSFQAARQIHTTASANSVNTFLLMSEFIPAHYPMFFSLAWDHAKLIVPRDKRELRIRSYAYMCYIFSTPFIPDEQKTKLLGIHSRELMQKPTADIYDVAYLLMLESTQKIIRTFGSFYTENFLDRIQRVTLDEHNYESMLDDSTRFEWITKSNPELFGDEMQVLVHMIKALVHWRSACGTKLQDAVDECMKLLECLRNFGNRLVFLVDVIPLTPPVMILAHAGQMDAALEHLNFLHQICTSTHQLNVYQTILSYLPVSPALSLFPLDTSPASPDGSAFTSPHSMFNPSPPSSVPSPASETSPSSVPSPFLFHSPSHSYPSSPSTLFHSPSHSNPSSPSTPLTSYQSTNTQSGVFVDLQSTSFQSTSSLSTNPQTTNLTSVIPQCTTFQPTNSIFINSHFGDDANPHPQSTITQSAPITTHQYAQCNQQMSELETALTNQAPNEEIDEIAKFSLDNLDQILSMFLTPVHNN